MFADLLQDERKSADLVAFLFGFVAGSGIATALADYRILGFRWATFLHPWLVVPLFGLLGGVLGLLITRARTRLFPQR